MGFFAWIKSLFGNGKIDSLEECKIKTPTFKGKCVDHHATKIQAQFKHINESFDDCEADEIADEWTDPG